MKNESNAGITDAADSGGKKISDKLKGSKLACKKSLFSKPALVIEITPEMEYGVDYNKKPLNQTSKNYVKPILKNPKHVKSC